jgi:uncharacterized membrane protein YcjF (UPF0283 family)
LYAGILSTPVSDDQLEQNVGVDIPDASEAPTRLRAAFWSLVVVFNVALLAVSVGAMFVVFRGRAELGGGLVVAGALAFLVGVYRVRTVKDRLD